MKIEDHAFILIFSCSGYTLEAVKYLDVLSISIQKDIYILNCILITFLFSKLELIINEKHKLDVFYQHFLYDIYKTNPLVSSSMYFLFSFFLFLLF